MVNHNEKLANGKSETIRHFWQMAAKNIYWKLEQILPEMA
jgi:hypothetical protein